MRLQRALARAGVASRRASEDLIREGRVRVNGTVATIGTVVDPGHDRITVGKRALPRTPSVTWLALHKPVGHVTTRRDPQGRPTVYDLVPEIPGLTYVGRLDIMTAGLLLLTTDGEAVHRLTHPKFETQRAYRAIVTGGTPSFLRRALAAGIHVEGRRVGVARYDVRSLNAREVQLHVVLTEGRNRIVRRMCDEMGLTVHRLLRLRHGPIELGRLRVGEWRYLSKNETDRVGVRSAREIINGS